MWDYCDKGIAEGVRYGPTSMLSFPSWQKLPDIPSTSKCGILAKACIQLLLCVFGSSFSRTFGMRALIAEFVEM